MIFGIINNVDNGDKDGEVNGEVDGEVNGDKDIAKMHIEREDGRKKIKKNARALAYIKKK